MEQKDREHRDELLQMKREHQAELERVRADCLEELTAKDQQTKNGAHKSSQGKKVSSADKVDKVCKIAIATVIGDVLS